MTTHQVELVVPDLGDFSDVDVIEVLVQEGDEVAIEEPLITLETDKASMDVPSTHAGKIESVNVKVGDKVNAGDVIASLVASVDETPDETVIIEPDEKAEILARAAADVPTPQSAPQPGGKANHEAQLVVIGSGPGGYTAAFRAADLGMQVILVERYPVLGGVCLNVGCIPSKALLHAAKVIEDAAAMAEHGVKFGKPEIDASALRGWKDKVVGRLTGGLAQLAKQRKVTVVQGTAKFASANRLVLDSGETIDFQKCIIAAGSQSAELPGIPDDPRIVDSTGALELDPIPKRMLVVGGGIIGLEMATVYQALGSRITVVELLDHLMAGVDRDLVRPLAKRLERRCENIFTGTKVAAMTARKDGIWVSFEGDGAPAEDRFDRVLVAVGRRPNGDRIRAERAGVRVDDRGFVAVDELRRTNVPHIYAIGDVTGAPLLAHKATHEGKTAAEVIAGLPAAFEPGAIPSVAYTDPEIAWMGLTEEEARERGVEIQVAKFPWSASGRALGSGRSEGVTKLIFAADGGTLLGAGITGVHAGELIAESVLALEMGADAEDLGLTIHPHPTLSETVGMAAEIAHGTVTDLYLPPTRRKRTNA